MTNYGGIINLVTDKNTYIVVSEKPNRLRVMCEVLAKREPISRFEVPLTSLPENLSITLDYWSSLSDDDLTQPRWSDFDLLKVPSVLLPMTMVYDVRDPHIECKYRYWGSGMTTLYGKDYTGLRLADLQPYSVRDRLAAALKIVCETKAPNAHTPHFTNNFGKTERNCILRLPIFDEPGIVTKIVTLIDSSQEAMKTLQQVIGDLIDQDLAKEE